MREDPRADSHIKIDLREERARLIAACEAAPVRLGRISALGSWGDAVLVARSAQDLRALCLIPWALDPTISTEGRKQASRLSQAQFEEKIAAYTKRLEELDEEQILSDIGPATLTRQGDLLILDVLEEDGTWDLMKSLAVESALASISRFSILPGAPWTGPAPEAEPEAKATETAAPDTTETKAPDATEATAAAEPELAAKAEAPPVQDAPVIAPVVFAEVQGKVLMVFPDERFDLDVATSLGKKDYESVVQPCDHIDGRTRDRIMTDGAEFVAPLEFLSEVFVDGKPLSRAQFDEAATSVGDAKTMEVHYPRFGPVVLIQVPEVGRFVSSQRDVAAVVQAIRQSA